MRLPLSIFAICSLLAASGASANLIQVDLATPGDGLVTRDTSTGLDWLNLSLTTNLSYDDVMAGVGNSWLAQGWRYATTGEVCGLATEQLGAPTPCPQTSIDAENAPTPAVEDLISRLGTTEPPGPNGTLTAIGLFNDGQGTISSGTAGIGTLYNTGTLYTAYVWVRDPWIIKNSADPAVGSFLVRPVPEPSGCAVFGIGLLSVLIPGRRLFLRGS